MAAPVDTHSDPDVFHHAFSPEEQQELRAEDSEAWSGVTGILLLLVSIGTLLAIITVAIIVNFTILF